MLFYQNLDKIVFNRYQLFKCDELIILSGYVGPTPVQNLSLLPIKSTVVYGMYGSDGIQKSLHEILVSENNAFNNVDILYSQIPIHSKCYIWRNKGEVVHALIGSANFSTNGLTTPFKEILAETSADTFDPLNEYLQKVIDQTIPCYAAISKNNTRAFNFDERQAEYPPQQNYDRNICPMPLYIVKNGQPVVPPQSGINWGMAKLSGSHVNINDAYIRIGADLLEKYPQLFPKKQECPTDERFIFRANHRHNDNIEILWDDGVTMTGLLEGSIPKTINGQRELYPKQISTTPKKSRLGEYLRTRLGIPYGKAITYEDLKSYGRTTIDVSLQGEGIYYFDFSVKRKI